MIQSLDKVKHTSIHNQFAKGSMIGLIGLALGYGLQYLFTLLTTRSVDTEEAGMFFAFFASINLLALVARFGLDKIALKQISIYSARGEWHAVRRVIVMVLIVVASLGIIMSGGMWYGRPFLLDLLNTQDPNLATPILGLAIVPLALSFTLSQFLRGIKYIGLAATVQLILVYLVPSVGILVSNFLGIDLTTRTIAWFVLAGTILATGTGLIFFFFYLTGKHNSENNSEETFGDTLLRVPFMFGISLLTFIISGLDVIILGILLPETDVALYVGAFRTTTVISVGLVGINSIAGSLIASHYKNQDMQMLEEIIKMSSRWSLAYSSFAGCIIIFFGWWILRLFGNEFDNAIPILYILMIGQLINSSVGPVSLIQQMTNGEKAATKVLAFSACLMPFLYIVLVNQQGVVGAALATIATMLCWNVSMMISVQRRIGILSLADNFGRSILFLTACGLISFFISWQAQDVIISLLLIALIAPTGVWFVVLKPVDRKNILSLVHRFLPIRSIGLTKL